jgi:hypothetical protein
MTLTRVWSTSKRQNVTRTASRVGNALTRLFSSSAFVAIVCGCGTDEPLGTEPVTYHAQIRAVVEASCTQCHAQGGIAPFALDTPDAVRDHRAAVVDAVLSGAMPPWPASDDCHPLTDVRRLPDPTRRLFSAWRAQGYPEGSASEYEAPPATPSSTAGLGEPDIILPMAEPYTTDPAIADNYRCFLLPGGFEQDTYVRAIDIRPDQRHVVHHVQIHTIPGAGVATAESNDALDPGPGYTCFGGPAVGGASNIYSWRPGAQAIAFAPGDAALIEAGTRVVIQVHYNAHAIAPGEPPPADQSEIAFWKLPDGAHPDRIVARRGIISAFSLKAGERHVAATPWPVASEAGGLPGISVVNGHFLEGEIIGQTPHMHALGTRLAVTLTRPEEGDRCLIDVPNWDFEWQMDYFYPEEAFVPFRAGDVVKVQCEWDNTAENQPFVHGVRQTPRDVGWGEGTLDEMCLNYVWMRYARDAYIEARRSPP